MQVTIDTNHISQRDMRLLSLVLDLVADELKNSPTPRELHAAETQKLLHPNDHPGIGADTSPVDTKALFAGNGQTGQQQAVDTAAMFGAGSTSINAAAPAAAGLSHGVAPQTQQGASGAIQGAAPAGAVERDSEGYPWDERIHSSSKKKTDGGAWILKKGINNDKAKLNRVKAELMQTMPLQQGAAAQQTNPGPVFQQASQQQNPAAAAPMQEPATLQTQMQQAGMIPPPNGMQQPVQPNLQQMVPPNPVAQPQGDPTTLPELMGRVGPMIASGVLPPNALNMVVEQLGLPGLQALATTHAVMVPSAWALLKR